MSCRSCHSTPCNCRSNRHGCVYCKTDPCKCVPCRSVVDCCTPPRCGNPDNPTYPELVAQVKFIMCNLQGFVELSKRTMSIGELLPKVEELCRNNNALLAGLNQAQLDIHKLQSCGDGTPTIVSIAAA